MSNEKFNGRKNENTGHSKPQFGSSEGKNQANTKAQIPENNLKKALGGKQEINIISIDLLIPYSNHPFKLYEGERLEDMVRSVKELGVLSPIIVRPHGSGQYEILSGHNRVNAAKLAGLKMIPVIVKETLSVDEARLIVTETNLQQRSFSDLSHSERAFCLSQHYDALKCQGKRRDIVREIEALVNPGNDKSHGTSAELQQKLGNREKLTKNYSLSKDKVAKYIRLSKLIPALLEKVDNGQIAFLPAYQLSFIEDKDMQNIIFGCINTGGKLDMERAVLLREKYESGALAENMVEQIFSDEKAAESIKPFKLNTVIMKSFFSAKQGKKEIEGIILKALTLYFTNKKSKEGISDD